MKKSLIFVSLTLFLLQFQTLAQEAFQPMKDTAAFRREVAMQAKVTQSIESDFVQEKNMSVLSEKIITKGHFYFKKENMLRWEYLDPFNYVIILNKDKVTIKDDNKVSRYDMNANKMFRSINDMMINSVQGNVLDSKDYTIKLMENQHYFLVEMTPVVKETKAFLKTINLYFSRTSYTVSRVKMTEVSGDYTSIEFVNQKKNESIPDSKFTVH